MAVWFTSDHHIGHAFIASLRWDHAHGVEGSSMGSRLAVSPERTKWHDDMLAERWDSVVHKDDTVWVLGDISAGGSMAQLNALTWFHKRPGTKHLIAGNHDGCHPMHRDSHKWQNHYLGTINREGEFVTPHTFNSVQVFARRRIPLDDGATQTVLLSHFPYSGDHTPGERFEEYRLRDMGLPIIHGHLHVKDRTSKSDAGTRQIHVGVDAWDFYPVHMDTISEILT